MPFPWKKAKVNRISRLVADLHQSPKRGGSLVVETGFPTSLIDLFVKNRDRLRKQTSKRKSGISPPSQSQIHSLPQSVPSVQQKAAPSPEIEVGELVLVKRDECAEERIAFPAGFKVFLAVALAVSTPTLAVWIMAAAFLLLLLEFVGTRYFRFLRPQSQLLFLASWVRKGILVLNKRWDWDLDLDLDLEKRESRPEFVADQNRVEEIEIEESKSDSMEKVCESESEMLGKRMEVLINESERENTIQSLGIELEKDNSTATATATERKGKSSESGYMILILFGTVLGGLLGGRGFALLLTLVWCLIVRYSINFGFGRFRLRRRTETGKTSSAVLSRCLASKRLSG
ncbi:ethylene-responsive/regulated nuclear protein [Corchorus olitorius]|uniref:Ethylene-responsive/regulated nuclear protein n=1 Tax=Corchorus olitorius TaxID=93759 RepID=A0A1R3HTT4_9ROSI|nr:ethylene-responsive/regulated nuclear protein [Corchorus olitorius]